MKKNLLLLTTILLLSGVALAACTPTPLTAEQVLQKLVDNAAKLKTGHTEMVMDMSAEGQTITMNAAGVFETPDKSYLTLTLLGQTMQMLVLSPTEIYQRATDADAWVLSETAGTEQVTNVYDFSKNPEFLLKHYSNAQLLAEEQVDGVDCYHLTFDLDVLEMLKESGIDQATLEGVTFPGPAKIEAWIGKADFFSRKVVEKFVMNSMGQEVTMDIVVTQTAINQPVEIPTP